MVAKEDKDGQIKLLREALESINAKVREVENQSLVVELSEALYSISKIADLALVDTTF